MAFKFVTELNDQINKPTQVANLPTFKFATELNPGYNMPSQAIGPPVPGSMADLHKLDDANPLKEPIQTNQPTVWDQIKALDIKGLTGVYSPGQFFNDFGNNLTHALSNLPAYKSRTNVANMLTSSSIPAIANEGKRELARVQANTDYLNSHPVSNSFGGMIGSMLPELPLWASGEGIVEKGISKLAPSIAEKVGAKLPGFVKGGLKDALTYGTVVAPVETISQGDGLQGLADREKQLPAIALGGMALRGTGEGLKLGKDVIGEGGSLKQALALRKLNTPEIATNPLQDVQNAYQAPSLRDVKAQELTNPLPLPKYGTRPPRVMDLQQSLNDAAGVKEPLTPVQRHWVLNNLQRTFAREQPLETQRFIPEPIQSRVWTNREGIQSAGQLPLRSITEDNLGQLPNGSTPMPEQNNMLPRGFNSNQGIGHEVIEPSRGMNSQSFNDNLPELPNTMSHVVSKTERQIPSVDSLKTNAYIKTTDNLHRLNQLDQYVESVTGSKLSPEDKAYMLALNSRGTGSTVSHVLEDRLVNPKGEAIGDSLKTILKPFKNKNLYNEFNDYLINKHAITRMRAGEKVFPDEMQMTPEMSEAKVKQYEAANPEFKDAANKLYEFQNKLAKSWLVDTGIVPADAYGKWIQENPHYVPNNRLFSEMEQTSFGTRRGFANQSNPVKSRTGSQRKIIQPIESIMEHVDQYVKVAKRNEVMQSLIRNIQRNPEEFKDWAEIIPSDKQAKEGLMNDINKTLQTQGIDGVVEQFNKQFDDIFNAKKQNLDRGNVVTGIINGEKIHVKVNDPLLLDALTNLKPQAQNVVIQAMGQLTRTMKNLTTGINPVFGLARNIWRDIPTAFINSKSTNNPFVFGKDLLGSIVDVLGDREAYKSYKAMGGGHAASSVSADRNALAESKARLLPKYGIKHPFKTAIGGLERLNNAVESAPRLAEYKRISKPGDYGSKVKGIFEANDVTVNFNKFGNVVKEADAIVPYLNAAWQGLDKLARSVVQNPLQTIPKAFVAITIPTVLLYQLNHNNPAYQQLSDYIKDNNFLIPKGDGTFIKIPKPRELGVMFGSSVERSMRQWQDQDPQGFNRFAETIKTNFMPPIRTVADPIWRDLPANKDFMDRPIVSGALSKLSPSLQYDEKTSEPAKIIGKTLHASPQQIDYLAKSYLGVIGQLGLPATTKNATPMDVLNKQFTADPTYSNDIINDFYTTKNKIDTSASDAKATGDKSLVLGKKYQPLFNKTALQLSVIRKKIDKVQASNLDNTEKESQIRNLQLQMLSIAQKANKTFKLK